MKRYNAHKVIFQNNKAITAQQFFQANPYKAIEIATINNRNFIKWMVVYSLNEKDAIYMANCITEEFLSDVIG